MLKLKLNNSPHTKSALLISTIFLVLFFHYIFNEKFRLWYISITFVLIFFYYFKRNKIIKPNLALIIFCCINILTYTSSYYLFDRLDNLPSKGYLKTYKRIVDQYFWFLAFITLPTIFYFSKFTVKIFYNLLFGVVLCSFFYVTYFNIILEFDRDLLSAYFNPIITYDIGLTALSILILCYSFYLKDKKSYLFLSVSLLAMFSLVLHGSRGTWLALPFIYLLIFVLNFKRQTKKCIFFLTTIFLFIIVNISLPSTPLMNRITDFNNDKIKIQQNSYQNSTGIRLLLWENSIELFKTKPIIGVGLYEIEKNNCKLHTQGKIPLCFQHQHNIYFHELAANGLVGILGLLITLLLPFFYFLKNYRYANEKLKLLSISGISFIFYFAICGATEYYLFFLSTTFLYFLIVATLISFIQLEKYRLKTSLAL